MANRRPRQGETNLIVVGVVAACCAAAVALIGAFMIHQQKKRSQSICVSNIRQVTIALTMYSAAHDGQIPTAKGFIGGELAPYLGTTGPLYCPDGSSAGDTDYVYLGAGLNLTKLKSPSSTILIHDKLGNHEGTVNCAYADGSARSITTAAANWEAFRKERQAAGDVILNEPSELLETPGTLPTYQ